MRTSLPRILMALAVASLALLAGALPALAHTYLEESQPMWDTTVSQEVTQIVLRFNEPVLETIAEIEVTAPDGSTFGTGEVTIDGPHVTRAVTPFTATGVYTVDYMIIAGDGHPLEETFTFTYEGPVAGAAAPPPASEQPAPETSASEPMAMDSSASPSPMTMDSSASPSPMAMMPTEDESEAAMGGATTPSPSPAAMESMGEEVAAAESSTSLPTGRVWMLGVAAVAALAVGLLALGAVRRFEPPTEVA